MKERTAKERGSVRLERRRRWSRLMLGFERVWPAIWPALGVLGAFIVFALFGVIAWLPAWPHIVLLALFFSAFVLALALGFSRFVFPSQTAADRRLEAVNGLTHRPLSVLTDHPVTESGGTTLVWRAYRARTLAKLAHVRVGLPHPGLAARDRHALRLGLLLLLVAGLVVAGSDALPRVADAFTPKVPTGPAPAAPELAAWITPPAYTHLPPVFLALPGGTLSVPRDSELAVSVTGGRGAPHLAFAGRAYAFHEIAHTSFRAAVALREDGALILRRGGGRLGTWNLTMIPPGTPAVAFDGRPGTDPSSAATRIPWKISDRYGVTELTAVLSLAARPAAKPIRIPVPLANVDPRHAAGAALANLSANPWAGLEVRGQLIGKNGAGLRGESAVVDFRLPEITFHNAIARALIAIRKGLALDPKDRARASAGLAQLAQSPAVENGDFSGFLNMRAIAALLRDDQSPAVIGEAEQRLWQLAWHYEAGPMARTRRALAAAERALEHALAKAGEKNGAKIAALDRRIATLEQAIHQQIAALAKSLAEKGMKLPDVTAQSHYDARTFDKLTQAMRQAVNRGDLKTARNEMAELQRLLQQLQNAQPLSPAALARARQLQKAGQAMSALSDVVGREDRLVNHAQSRLAQESAQQQAGQSLMPPAAKPRRDNAQKTPSANEDQAMQRALRRALGVLMSDLADASGKVPSALGQADIAMRGAAEALGKSANGRAAVLERQAIADLQRGGQQAMAAMAQQGRGQGARGFMLGLGPRLGNQPGGGQGPGSGVGFDPLGRPLGDREDGGRSSGYVAIPDQDVAAAARAIQEELRRRVANPELPVPDRNYIDRLLKQF